MRHTKTIPIHRIHRSLRAVFAALLVLLYTVGTVEWDTIHEFVHTAEHVVDHSVQQESDPCHISLYHQASQHGCEHQFHVTSKSTCPACNIIAHSDQVLTSPEEQVTLISFPSFSDYQSERKISSVHHTLSNRGPPVS